MGLFVLMCFFEELWTGNVQESCEPITWWGRRLCAQRCVHRQPAFHLQGISTDTCLASSTNQMEANRALTNGSDQHQRACGANHTEGLTNLQKREKSQSFRKFFLKSNEEKRRGRSGFFARDRSAGRTQRGEGANLKQWRSGIFAWSWIARSKPANRFTEFSFILNFYFGFLSLIL